MLVTASDADLGLVPVTAFDAGSKPALDVVPHGVPPGAAPRRGPQPVLSHQMILFLKLNLKIMKTYSMCSTYSISRIESVLVGVVPVSPFASAS